MTASDDNDGQPRPPAPRRGSDRAPRPRRPYRSPRLTDYGDVRDLTLGGTPGVGDSANPNLTKPPGFGLTPPGSSSFDL